MSCERNPLEIRRIQDRGLVIEWSDGVRQEIPSRVLRLNCPCASCKESRGDNSHSKPLSPRSSLRIVDSSSEEQLQLKRIWSVGQYAIGLEWGDGHSTGIFPFELLARLDQELSTTAPQRRDC